MKIHRNPIEESFTAKSKASGRVVNFASQQNRDDAVKSGEYEETDDAGGEPAAAKPKVNIFDKPKPQAQPASDSGGDSKPSSMVAPPVVKTPVDVLKSKVEKWSEKEKAFFRDGIHKQDSPERRNWKDAIKDKAKGAIAAIKKGAKHEVEEFKAAGAGVKNFFSGKELSEHEKKALKAVAIKVATTAIFGAVTGGAGHGALAFGKHVAMEFIPHVVGETILKGAGTAALFAGDEEEDIDMERFMAIIADKMANEKITPELMTQMVDSYNAKKGESVNEEKVYIDFLNKQKGFKQDRIKFNSYEDAVKWARKNFEKFNPDMIKYESINEEVRELTPDQSEMVQGIIDMLLQIKDTDNRMEVAQKQIQNFKDEEIVFNYAWFLSAAGLDNNDEPVRMDVKTQPQHIINKESIMIGKINEDFKHIIHVDTPTQVVSKPIAAQVLALAKKGIRSKDIGLEMGFVGNAKLATDTFQKVKNKIYFELGNKNESVNEGSHGMATKLLQSIVSGDSSRAEGTKMSKELAQHYIDWIRTSPFGKKNGNLPLDMLVKASFNWGIERGLDSKLKGELSKLKSTIKESVNEAKYIQPKDDWGVRLVQAINNNVKGLHTSVIREKRDAKEAVEAFGTMLKNSIKETLKHKYKPHPKAKDADTKIKTFISELKKFDNIVDMVIAKPTKNGVTKLDDAWRSVWNYKYAAEIALAGEVFNSIVESKLNEVKYPTDLKVGSVVMGQGFTMLKGIEGGKYYKIVDMDDTTATLVPSDKSGNTKGSSKVRHKLDSIEGGIKTAKRGDENGIVVIKESVNEVESDDVNWDVIENVFVNFLIKNTKELQRRVKAKHLDSTKSGIKSIISGLVNAQRSLKLESVNEEDTKSPEETLASLKQMAMGDLERIEDYAEMISDRMKEGQELSAWMYSQITLAVDQLNAVHDTMDGKDGVKESVNEEKPGLWANIRAKKARGGEPAHGNSKAHKDAVKAGKKINDEVSTPGEQIQNLNNRLTKLRQDMAKAKSPEAKNVIQAKMKNALQKLSDKKKDMGIKKP